MRLIDDEKAYEEVVDLSGQASTKSAYAAFWKAGKIIKKLPTVDAVQVVRCKDCKHSDWFGSVPYCLRHDCNMYAEGFCSDGERGDGDE